MLLIVSLMLVAPLAQGAEHEPVADSAPQATTTWQGSIEVVEYLLRPVPVGRDLQQAQQLLTVLDERIVLRRQQRDQAQEPERGSIEQDILALESDLRDIQESLGGRHDLSHTRFVLANFPRPLSGARLSDAGALARADVGGGVLVANWREGLLRGRDRWQRFEGALPLRRMRALAVGEEAGEQWAGRATRRLTLRSNDGDWIVDYITDIPNPWAALVTTDLDEESYPVQFARVPGLPVRCRRALRSGGHLTFEVTAVDAFAPDIELFANP